MKIQQKSSVSWWKTEPGTDVVLNTIWTIQMHGFPFFNQAAEVFARMHMIGHFKQYLTQGIHTTTLSWQKGNPPQVPSP
jgi:hypothetical protein